MKPIYFPFTFIPESVAKALAACFGQTTVYQISGAKIPDDMQNLVEDGILDIRMPMPINGELLDKIHKDYRAWIDTHQGTEITFLKTMANKIPFFNKDAPSQIRAELKNTIRRNPAQEKPDPLFNAGLFLHMAQEYDFQNERLSRDLRDIDTMEADIIEDLKGEEEDVPVHTVKHKAIEIKDPGRYMTAERIAAWASFMLKDSQRYGLFLTTSRAVVDHILDILPETNQINRFDAVSAGSDKDEAWGSWRSEFMKSLEMLAIHARPAGVDDMRPPPKVSGRETNISLTLYMVPEKAPRECFTRFLDTDSLHEDSTKTGSRIRNTLIGIIEAK
jgi:hypothetical protein